MTLPGSFSKVTVTGTYTTLTGELAKGKVTFTPDSKTWLTAVPEKVVIVPKTITADLTNGTFAVDLPATDDPDILPNGGTYVVTEVVGTDSRTYSIQVPVGSGPIDLATVAPVQPVTATSRLVTSVNGVKPNGAGAISLTPASIGALGATELGVMVGGVGDGVADDTTALQAALTAGAGGKVLGRPGRTYLISAPLVISSGTTLDMTGCTVRLKAGSNCNFLQNAAYTSIRTVTDAATTAGSTTVTSATAAFTSADIGRMVSIAGAGPIGAGPGREVLYGEITAVTDATTVTIATSTSGVTGAHAAVTGAALKVFNRDARIKIRGGLWARGTNDGTGNNRHNLLFRRVDDLLIESIKVTSSSGKYGVSLGDVTDFRVRDAQFETSSDGVHILGPATGGSVSGIRGTLGDDAAGITACDYTTYTDTVGDVVGVEITDVVASTPTTALLKFTSAPGVLLDQVHVRGATQLAPTQPAFAFADDTGELNVGAIEMSDIVGRGYILDGTIGTLRLRNWRWTATGDTNVGLYVEAAVGTLDISGATASSAYTSTDFLRIDPGASITHLVMNEVRFQGGTTSYLVRHADGTSGVSRAMLSNVRRDCTGTGGGLYQASASGVTLGVLMLNNVYVDAGAWFADLITATAIHVANCHGQGTAKTFNVRAGGNVQVYGSYILGLAGANAGTLRSRTLGFSFDVSALGRNANDMAYNTNAALSCGTGPVVSDGTTWKHLHTGATY